MSVASPAMNGPTSYESLAAATVRIECDDTRGSGFFFLHPTLVVTNHHVVEGGREAVAVTEGGTRLHLDLRASSPATEHDCALLTIRGAPPTGATILQPKILDPIRRGTPLMFAGFPHGIPHLLVQRAVVAGLLNSGSFYLDGSVNGGNSGGPIVDAGDGQVVGIVTQRRFLGAQDLNDLKQSAEELSDYCEQIAGRGSVQIMGIDFGGFAGAMSDGLSLIKDALEANANTGIGVGFSIEYATRKAQELRLP